MAIRKSVLWLLVLCLGIVGAARGDLLYYTSFESGEGYALGDIDTQLGWGTYPAFGPGEFNVSAATASDGSWSHEIVSTGTAPGSFSYGDWSSPFAAPVDQTLITVSLMTYDSAMYYTDQWAILLYDNDSVGTVSYVDFYDPGGALYARDGADFAGPLAAIIYDTWVPLSMVFDFATDTYDVYYNGSLVGDDLAVVNAGGLTSNLDVEFYKNDVTAGELFYVDELMVTSAVPEPGACVLLGLGAVGLVLYRRKKKG